MAIYIALGANLDSEVGPPRATLEAALARFPDIGLAVAARSRWFVSRPVPRSDQPDFVNAVVAVETALTPVDVMSGLLDLEAAFGRVRQIKWEARVLDLDLIDYDGCVERFAMPGGAEDLVLPHPRAHERAFVLLPLRDVAPHWRHPVTNEDISELIGRLRDRDDTAPLPDVARQP